jgi:hypothetical protein
MKKFIMFKNRMEAEIADARKGLTRNGYGNLLNGSQFEYKIQNTKQEVLIAAQSKA